MADDPTEDVIRREISAAVAILKSDGLHVRRTIGDLLSKTTAPPEETQPPGDGKTPPVKKTPSDPIVKKGIWWGTTS